MAQTVQGPAPDRSLEQAVAALQVLETLLPPSFIGSIEVHVFKAGISNVVVKQSLKPAQCAGGRSVAD